MLSFLVLFLSFTNVYADVPVPDEFENHYKLTVNIYNVSNCLVQPYSVYSSVSVCSPNGTSLPNCCKDMLKSYNPNALISNISMCNNYNSSSYFASCDQYYTESQIEYGKIFGYVVLAIICLVAVVLFFYCLVKCLKCCRDDRYSSLN
tara:strand:+ start:1054 stop:1497 length:444 start_codon:yes stop_codon:yes gene_type:complete